MPEIPSPGALVATDVCKSYQTPTGPRPVLVDIGLQVAPGASLAIMGPSGSGKSTLLNILGALDIPDGGRLKLGELDVRDLDEAGRCAYRNQDVGFIFQDHHLLPQCTALENVLLPALARGEGRTRQTQAQDLLARVGLAARATALPAELSGGERQRVAIARALINEPRLLLCDEPTGNLDRANEESVADLFAGLATERNTILVLVTHNQRLAARFARQAELTDGRLVYADS